MPGRLPERPGVSNGDVSTQELRQEQVGLHAEFHPRRAVVFQGKYIYKFICYISYFYT